MSSALDEGITILRSHVQDLPSKPGTYRMIDAKGKVLYVGKAKLLAKRVSQYTNPEKLSYRIKNMVSLVKSLEYTITETEAEALLLEANLIKDIQPPFNILLKDDKSYPYLMITKDHAYPRLCKYRGTRNEKGHYFGPFATAGAMHHIIKDLQKAFLIRPCTDSFFSNRTRPCMEYQIKRCSAPCVNLISKEDYAALVSDTLKFLEGKNREIQEKLATQMQTASEAMDYEKAAAFRDRIRALNQIQSRQSIDIASVTDADIFALYQENEQASIQLTFYRKGRNLGGKAYFPEQTAGMEENDILRDFIFQFYQSHPLPDEVLFSHKPDDVAMFEDALSSLKERGSVKVSYPQRGEKKELINQALTNAKAAFQQRVATMTKRKENLVALQQLFELDKMPHRVEVYDNSHVMGTHQVGAMIVATPDGFDKRSYRRFNIRSTDIVAGDDYGMMREVLTRRLTRLMQESPDYQQGVWPDILLIDGGKGQLSSAMQVLDALKLADKITCVAISKGPDRNAGREQFHIRGRDTFSLPLTDTTLFYLQNIRDEAHRFAIGSHRAKRAKALTKSSLDDVPGIGMKRKTVLLRHFGSAKAVAEATIEELTKVDGVSQALAADIYGYFH